MLEKIKAWWNREQCCLRNPWFWLLTAGVVTTVVLTGGFLLPLLAAIPVFAGMAEAGKLQLPKFNNKTMPAPEETSMMSEDEEVTETTTIISTIHENVLTNIENDQQENQMSEAIIPVCKYHQRYEVARKILLTYGTIITDYQLRCDYLNDFFKDILSGIKTHEDYRQTCIHLKGENFKEDSIAISKMLYAEKNGLLIEQLTAIKLSMHEQEKTFLHYISLFHVDTTHQIPTNISFISHYSPLLLVTKNRILEVFDQAYKLIYNFRDYFRIEHEKHTSSTPLNGNIAYFIEHAAENRVSEAKRMKANQEMMCAKQARKKKHGVSMKRDGDGEETTTTIDLDTASEASPIDLLKQKHLTRYKEAQYFIKRYNFPFEVYIQCNNSSALNYENEGLRVIQCLYDNECKDSTVNQALWFKHYMGNFHSDNNSDIPVDLVEKDAITSACAKAFNLLNEFNNKFTAQKDFSKPEYYPDKNYISDENFIIEKWNWKPVAKPATWTGWLLGTNPVQKNTASNNTTDKKSTWTTVPSSPKSQNTQPLTAYQRCVSYLSSQTFNLSVWAAKSHGRNKQKETQNRLLKIAQKQTSLTVLAITLPSTSELSQPPTPFLRYFHPWYACLINLTQENNSLLLKNSAYECVLQLFAQDPPVQHIDFSTVCLTQQSVEAKAAVQLFLVLLTIYPALQKITLHPQDSPLNKEIQALLNYRQVMAQTLLADTHHANLPDHWRTYIFPLLCDQSQQTESAAYELLRHLYLCQFGVTPGINQDDPWHNDAGAIKEVVIALAWHLKKTIASNDADQDKAMQWLTLKDNVDQYFVALQEHLIALALVTPANAKLTEAHGRCVSTLRERQTQAEDYKTSLDTLHTQRQEGTTTPSATISTSLASTNSPSNSQRTKIVIQQTDYAMGGID